MQYKERLQHLDQATLAQVLLEASANFLSSATELDDFVKELSKLSFKVRQVLQLIVDQAVKESSHPSVSFKRDDLRSDVRDPTIAESRKIFRCLQRLINSTGGFLQAILSFADALLVRVGSFGGISLVSALVAVAGYFCPVPGGSAAIQTAVQNVKTAAMVGGGVMATGFGIACIWKCCEYSRAITSKRFRLPLFVCY